MTFLKRFNLWSITFIFLTVSIIIFLVNRASDEDRWSDWIVGDAQVWLSAKHWDKEGWLKNKLLLVPQGYAKVVYYFDEPELRQHAHGINPDISKLVSAHLRYTHYPSGYLIPYGFLMKIGFKDISWFRFLSIMFSITAVILMFILFCNLTIPSIAFFASLYYVLSRMFIGYADTISNQPIDDMFRFAFMLFIVFSTRAKTKSGMMLWVILAWVTEFLLSLSSFDSVFFVYVWLIGWDFIEGKGFRWKMYLVFVLAPITAHSLQFLQNIWYLGFQDAVNDAIGTFTTRSMKEEGYITGLYAVFRDNIENVVPAMYLLLLGFVLYMSCFYFKKNKGDGFPSLLLLSLLFVSGLAFFIIFTNPADIMGMKYHGRQFLPFVSLLVGTLTVSLFREFYDFLKQGRIRTMMIVYLVFVFFVVFQFWQKNIFHGSWGLNPLNLSKEAFNNDPNIGLAKYLGNKVKTRFEPVIFNINGFSEHVYGEFVPGYFQVSPVIEYYANAPVLGFKDPQGLAEDLGYLLKRSEYAFSPVIVGKGNSNIAAALSTLGEKGYIDTTRMQIDKLDADRYVVILDLTNYLQMEKVRWSKK